MPLPEFVRVKISTEDAGSITLTRVVAQDMRIAELTALIVAVTGKDAPRLRELLRRGSFTSGGSRFRWEPLETSEAEALELLAGFPDPDPSLPFRSAGCVRAVFRTSSGAVVITREAGARRRLFRSRTFWDELMGIAADLPAEYAGYSYRESADHYRIRLPAGAVAKLRAAADLLAYDTLARQIRSIELSGVELSVQR